MKKHHKRLLAALKKEDTAGIPFWFMRQAGRYLPEYRQLRGKAKSFLDFCYDPAMASEATLQPIRRFGMDGAIIFSDILVVPHALGVGVRFEENVGPVLVPVQTEKELAALSRDILEEKLAPVYEALRLTRTALPEETALIGFVGAPWTLACYVVEGKASRDFQKARSMALAQPAFFSRLVDLLAEAVTAHALAQIEAGAEVIQLFDSWCGVLSESQFYEWSVKPACAIVQAIRAKHPDVPVIGFPRMAGSKYDTYARDTKVDAVSIDASVSLDWAAQTLQSSCAVQGNLDPVALAEDKEVMLEEARRIVAVLGNKSFANKFFIFNLGHGVLPHTPLAHVQALCDFLRGPAASA